MRRSWRTDPHTLAGPDALDALTPADRDRFERHIARCEVCRQESDGLSDAAARLAAVTATAPPAHLRARVLTAVSRTRQNPPATGEMTGRNAARRLPLVAVPRLAVAAAGVSILLALGIGALTVSTQHRLGVEVARSHAIAMVLTAPDATMMTTRAAHGGTATIVMSHRHRALILTTARLPAPPAGDRYQVWLLGPDGTRSAGMLPAAREGMTAPIFVSGLAAGDRIGVTMETAGGARRPTSPPVLMLVLPS